LGPPSIATAPPGPTGRAPRLYFTDSGDWAATKLHPGRIVVIEKNGIEPDGSIVWVESYTMNVMRRKPDGAKQVNLQQADQVDVGVEGMPLFCGAIG
jgi:hypothetical protein